MGATTDEFAALLQALADHLERIWEHYEACGPGNVDATLLIRLDQLGPQLAARLAGPLPDDVDRVSLEAAVDQATELARHCVTRSQGLCFVSGEAGLVPRRDQVDAFAAARATIRTTAAKFPA